MENSNECKYTCVRFLFDDSEDTYYRTKHIFDRRDAELGIRPKNTNDFDKSKSYYAFVCICSSEECKDPEDSDLCRYRRCFIRFIGGMYSGTSNIYL